MGITSRASSHFLRTSAEDTANFSSHSVRFSSGLFYAFDVVIIYVQDVLHLLC